VLIERELLGELAQLRVVGVAEVQPDEGTVLLEVIRDLSERKIRGGEPALPPQTRPDRFLRTGGHTLQCARAQPTSASRRGSFHPGRTKWQVYPSGSRCR
jgi:hypothetical protein